MSRLARFFGVLSFGLHKIGTIVFLTAMVFLITMEVLLRYVFKAPLLWGKDLNGLLLLLVFFSVISFTWDARRHIRMEILYMRFGKKGKAFVDILAALTGMIIFGMLGIKSIEVIPYMMTTHETPEFLPVPLWPFSAFMAFCSFLLFIQLFVTLVRSISILQSKGEKGWS
jgi:TRAP-type C4-dicarboxylate transport system permease small subunit